MLELLLELLLELVFRAMFVFLCVWFRGAGLLLVKEKKVEEIGLTGLT